MPDFWGRKQNAQTAAFEFAPLGLPAAISANQADVLAAARLSAGRFSQAEIAAGPPLRLQIIVRPQPAGPVPPNLPERLLYTGLNPWLTVSAGAWGHGFAHLDSREAVVALSPELAANARLVSRYFIDHYLLNFILARWAMLHASCVLSPDSRHLIVMIAPHNTGKSTTALHLLRAGFIFLADGMALIRPTETGFLVGGYPIGEVKLRDDVLARFPEYTGPAVQVREHLKTVVDLRAVHPGLLAQTVCAPEQIHLCFAAQSGAAPTRLTPAAPAAVWSRLTANSIFYDDPARLAANFDTLATLLRVANIYKLAIGTKPAGIVSALARLVG